MTSEALMYADAMMCNTTSEHTHLHIHTDRQRHRRVQQVKSLSAMSFWRPPQRRVTRRRLQIIIVCVCGACRQVENAFSRTWHGPVGRRCQRHCGYLYTHSSSHHLLPLADRWTRDKGHLLMLGPHTNTE